MKIFSGYSVLIIFLIMLASVIGATFIAKGALPDYNNNWKTILTQDIKDYKQSIENVIENPSDATKLLYEKDIKRLHFYQRMLSAFCRQDPYSYFASGCTNAVTGPYKRNIRNRV
jgi:hypothetical protein